MSSIDIRSTTETLSGLIWEKDREGLDGVCRRYFRQPTSASFFRGSIRATARSCWRSSIQLTPPVFSSI